MANIKLKERIPIKTFDKTKNGMEKIKDNLINIKDKSEDIYENQYNNPEDYATQRIKDKSEILTNKSINSFDKRGKKSIEDTKQNLYKVKNKVDIQIEKSRAKKIENKLKDIKTKDGLINVKSKIKSTNQNIKRANNLSKKAIKTSERVTKKAAKATKESIKMSQKIAKMSKEVAVKTIKGAKVVIKATIQAIKAIATGTKALVSLLIAGGWISVIVILIVCIFGGIMAVFNSKGDKDTSKLWNNSIVAVAKTQLEVTGGDPYWSWYGFDSRVEWCACYVSWCEDQCGFISDNSMPKFSVCTDGINWFKDKDEWYDRVDNNFYPKSGDIIFFDWADKTTGERNGVADHVGIVEDVIDGKVHTIEGNSSDACKEQSYDLTSLDILGYGVPSH